MRTLVTALAVLTILMSVVVARKKPETPTPKGPLWALAAVNLALAAAVSWARPA
ncbi:hypothetical protein AB0A70_31080 [Streptomyces morookaense]|uniref:hypothetical protein n=1 Tax=Streptomyces morookaense TaxID=1970 RepID=UPI0033F340A3